MLKQRVITAFAMLFGLLGAVFLTPRAGWMAVSSAVVGVAAWEWAGLGARSGVSRFLFSFATVAFFGVAVVAIGLAEAPVSHSAGLAAVLASGAGFWLVVAPFWLSAKWPMHRSGVGTIVGWLVIIPAGVALVVLRDFDPWMLLAAMAVVWVADIAAYFVGRAFGKRKLAPAISPGKSWEGAIGAVVFVLIFGIVVATTWAGLGVDIRRDMGSLLAYVAILVLLTGVSIIGDLFESLAKRQAGVKDSGNILPGHGGMLDRIDSLTSTLPLVALALVLLRG